MTKFVLLALAYVLLSLSTGAQDRINPPGKTDSKDPLLRILLAESQGKTIDRSAELSKWLLLDQKQAIADGLDSSMESLRWHSGQIQIAKEWIFVKELGPSHLNAQLEKYQKERGKADLNLNSHRKMARWCQHNDLNSQARAHWFAILELIPSDAEANQALGFVHRDNRWLSPEEMKTIEQRAREDFEAMKVWVPRVRDWVIAMEGQDTKKRLKAIQQLKDVQDPRIVPAIGIALYNVSPDTALHLLDVVVRFKTQNACFLLANLAMTDPSSELGIAAIDGLRKFPYELYVPDFLDMMSSEFQIDHRIAYKGNGAMKLQISQMRELRRKFDVDQFQRRFSGNATNVTSIRNSFPAAIHSHQRPDLMRLSGMVENQIARSIAENESRRVAQESEANTAQKNAEIRELQNRLATVLRAVTKEQFPDEPKPWWDWWDHYEELYVSGEKSMDYSYYEDTSVAYVEARSTFVFADNFAIYPPMRNVTSCLVAGTPIQTQSGLKSIESIQVGDLVVAQNIQSGEIQLRPVLRTTIRPPARTYDIGFVSGQNIRTTLGHRWWVIGKGWVKTKDLQVGMSIRSAEGFETIDSLKDADAAVTYNLMIDQDHTYFVGSARILSFDASEVIPTLYTVPGIEPSPLRSK